ncbi:MAG: transcriptional regulator [Desulfotomaculum sp.]|nr:transcriptional regulator [Desulfotomaculum sp.]MCL0081264.1 transcriptional regulator [Peptococcaceae bacterium]
MKLLFITYDAIFDEEIMQLLDLLEITGFTKWDRVLGKGQNSEPQLDTPVWPGFNCALVAVVSEEHLEKCIEKFKTFSTQFDNKAFKVFVLPVSEVII